MGSLLRQIYQDAIALNDEKKHTIHLRVEDEHGLVGYDSELRSAFSNLVVNAVKYTPDEGEITLRWWTDADGAHFSVEDNGIGIEPQHIPRLTERFYRADKSRTGSGTGLGLAIAKAWVEAMHGSIGVQSTPGQGSRFFFDVKFPVATAAQRIVSNTDQTVRHVLFIDDNPAALKILQGLAASLGWDADVARPGGSRPSRR